MLIFVLCCIVLGLSVCLMVKHLQLRDSKEDNMLLQVEIVKHCLYLRDLGNAVDARYRETVAHDLLCYDPDLKQGNKTILPFDNVNIVAPSTCSVDKAPAKDEIKKYDKIEVKAQLEAEEEKNVEIKKELKEKQMTRFQMHENHSKCNNYMFIYPPDVDFCYCKICKFKMQRHLECYECVDCAKMFTPKGCWIMPVMFGRGDPKTTNQRCPECFWADKKRRFQANQEREEIHKRKRELDQKRREEQKLRRTYEVKQDAFDLMELTMDENSPVGKLWQSLHDAGISCASALYKGIKERDTPAWKQWRDFKHVQAQEQRIMETVD